MSDATSVLFGLEREFSVLEVQRVDTATVKVIIEQAAREGPCPECGVFSGTVKDRPWVRLKDLPVSGQAVELLWRKRRLICGEGLCPQKTFTQVSAAVRPRARVTERLRERVAQAIASGNRAVSEVAGEYRVRVRVTDSHGATDTEAVLITGLSAPPDDVDPAPYDPCAAQENPDV